MSDPSPDEAASSGSARSSDLSLAVDDMVREVDMWRAESGRSVGDGGDGSRPRAAAAAAATAGVGAAAVSAGSLGASTGSDDSVVERGEAGGGGTATRGSGGSGNDRLRDGGDSTSGLGEARWRCSRQLSSTASDLESVRSSRRGNGTTSSSTSASSRACRSGLAKRIRDAANKEEDDDAGDGDFEVREGRPRGAPQSSDSGDSLHVESHFSTCSRLCTAIKL